MDRVRERARARGRGEIGTNGESARSRLQRWSEEATRDGVRVARRGGSESRILSHPSLGLKKNGLREGGGKSSGCR